MLKQCQLPAAKTREYRFVFGDKNVVAERLFLHSCGIVKFIHQARLAKSL